MKSTANIDQFVPHSASMSLLDKVLEYGDDWLHASVKITPQSMFIEEKGVPAIVGIEYLAQAVAAYAGTLEQKKGNEPKLGFLLSVRKYTCSSDYFPIGESLVLKVNLEMLADNGLSVFQTEIVGKAIHGSARLNVYQPANPDDLFQGNML